MLITGREYQLIGESKPKTNRFARNALASAETPRESKQMFHFLTLTEEVEMFRTAVVLNSFLVSQ